MCNDWTATNSFAIRVYEEGETILVILYIVCDYEESYWLIYFSGLSDPYCMLGLMTDDHIPEEKIKLARKKSRTVRDVLDEDLILVTKVKENTLNPVWNESFTM